MAEQDLTQVARQEIDLFSQGDWERYKELHAPDCVYDEVGTGRRIEGIDEIIEVNRSWKEAFPDAKGTVGKVTASGDTVTIEITWEGTQSGPMQGPAGELPPSNRRVTVRAVQVLDFADGRIKENRHYFDSMGMFAQLGAFEQAGAATA
jgi:steroid delta-isomerase-like uncharacterized protein